MRSTVFLYIQYYNDLDTSYFYANLLLEGAKKLDDVKYESLAYSWLTVYNFYRGRYYDAEGYINKAIKLQEQIKDTIDLGNSYINLMMIYTETNRYSKAIEATFKALKLFESASYKRGIVVSNGNLGILYSRMNDPEKALRYLKKTSALMHKYHEYSNLGELYQNIGINFSQINKNDSALIYFEKAIAEFRKTNEKKGITRAYMNIANTYAFNMNYFKKAFLYYDSAMNSTEGVIEGIKPKIYGNMGKAYKEMGNTGKSIEILKKALEMAELAKEMELVRDNCYELFTLYKGKGDYVNALKYFEKYSSAKDSVDIIEAKVTISNLESKFENEKNKLLINRLNEKREADHRIKLLLIAGVLLLLIILFLTVYGFMQKRKKTMFKNQLLKNEKEQLEQDVRYKSRQLTSQALMMMQKNKLLSEIIRVISGVKCIPGTQQHELTDLKRKLKKSIRSNEDWELFKTYFEEVNPEFFKKIHALNKDITPSELRLLALTKLNFNIKETASLLNISQDSVKTMRHVVRVKLWLSKDDNLYEFLSGL